MTISEHIKKRNQPYKIAQCVFGTLIIAAYVVAGALMWRSFAAKDVGILSSGVASATSIVCIVGFLGLFAAGMIPTFALRCPKCRQVIGPPKKNWRHCPCCGRGFDEEI
jgi:hypothetical protein